MEKSQHFINNGLLRAAASRDNYATGTVYQTSDSVRAEQLTNRPPRLYKLLTGSDALVELEYDYDKKETDIIDEYLNVLQAIPLLQPSESIRHISMELQNIISHQPSEQYYEYTNSENLFYNPWPYDCLTTWKISIKNKQRFNLIFRTEKPILDSWFILLSSPCRLKILNIV